jgi:hypothetical protein
VLHLLEVSVVVVQLPLPLDGLGLAVGDGDPAVVGPDALAALQGVMRQKGRWWDDAAAGWTLTKRRVGGSD